MTPIKKSFDNKWYTKSVLIDNKIDSLDKEMQLKIGRIKETRIYLPIFNQITNPRELLQIRSCWG